MLSLDGLTKRFGEILAIDEVSFGVAPGSIVGFLGPNGAGKSTTMRSVFGLLRPDAGRVDWQGRPVGAEALSRFGYLPEQRGLYPKMPVGEQVAYFAELKGWGRGEARRAAAEILTSLGLEDRMGSRLDELSHGNQQRVQLATALVHEPDLLVLDEPFSGLDPVAVGVLQELLRDRSERGAAVLFSSHQLDLIDQLCDEVVIIADGRVRTSGPVGQVRRSLGRHTLVVEVERPLVPLPETVAELVESVPGLRLAHGATRQIRLELPDESCLDQVLAAARNAGPLDVVRFEPPTLTEVFAAVSGPSAGGES